MRNQLKSVKEEIKKENDEFYGDQAIGGDAADLESDDDTEKNISNVLGNQPKQPFDLNDEVSEDEKEA